MKMICSAVKPHDKADIDTHHNGICSQKEASWSFSGVWAGGLVASSHLLIVWAS